MPLNWQLWDRIRSFARQANIYRTENTFQDQSQIDRIIAGGNFIDFGRSSALLEQTNLQINRLERYKDYDMMDEVGEVSLALDLYADEASLIDSERKHSIVVRARSTKIKRIIEDFLYNTLLIDREIRPMIRYLCKYGDFAAEIIPTKNRDGVASFRFINVYNFTRIQTKFGDLVGFYYQDPGSGAPVFMHPWQVMHLRLTSYESVYHPYGRCCTLCSACTTPTGYKLLKDIQIGDEVYSFDEVTQKPVVTTVLDKVLNGKKKTVIIKTKHRSIQVTPEHPMLTIIKNNYINERVWTKASERNQAHWETHNKRNTKTKQYVLAQNLVLGDKLVLPKFHNPGINIPIEKYSIDMSKTGRRLQIPDEVDVNFAKLMGFLIGDGWIPKSSQNGQLCFAEGEHAELNRKYIEIIQSSFGYEDEPYRAILKDKEGNERKYGYFVFNSRELTQTIANMGLVGHCWEKRIPKWVFVAKDEIKKAFIEGLVDSDGSTNIDEWGCERFQIELTSEELVKDLKVLLDQMNVKCGNISKRNRPDPITIIHGEEYERRDSWLVYWYNAKMSSGDLLHMGRRRTKYDHSSDDYLVETILSIEDGGEVEVGDIQVSAHHNFIADGVVIHNSILDGGRKDFKRLRLMEDAALIYRVTRAPEKRIFSIPVGNIPPQQVPQYMELIARQMKKFKFVDPATGQINERYSPLIQEDDFWLPKRCFSLGAKVPLVDGRTLTLRQIRDEFGYDRKLWVYSYNDKKGIIPALAKFVDGPKEQKLIEVELDNGSKYRCTTDHIWYTRDGKQKLAKDLQVNDSLFPFMRSVDKIGKYEYEKIWQSSIGWEFTHRLFGPAYVRDYVIHHKNFDKRDNRPENLISVPFSEHFKLHREHGRLILEKLNSDPTFAVKHRLGIERGILTYNKSDRKRSDDLLKRPNWTKRAWEKGYCHGPNNINLSEYLTNIKELLRDTNYNFTQATKLWNINFGHIRKLERHTFVRIITESGLLDHHPIQFFRDFDFHHELFVELLTTSSNIRELVNKWNNIYSHSLGVINRGMVQRYCAWKNIDISTKWLSFVRRDSSGKFVRVNHKVVAIREIEVPEDTYCLSVEGTHRFFLEDALVHNSDGTGPTVDTLPGAENLDAIADIEYFKKKMVAALKIPFNRVGIGEQEKNDGRSLASMSPEFAKAIQWIQREAALGIKKIIIAHLAMRGHSLNEIKGFDLAMTAASAIDELYRIETWNTRADIIANLKETGLFPDSWILERFTDMTREEIEEMEEERDAKVKKQAADEVVSVPEEKLSPEDKTLLREYREMEKRISTKRQEKIDEGINTPVDWYVNQNELDDLSKGDGEKRLVIIPVNLPDAVIREIKAETEALLKGSTLVDGPIQDIAAAVDEIKSSQPSMIAEESQSIVDAVEEVKNNKQKDSEKSEK